MRLIRRTAKVLPSTAAIPLAAPDLGHAEETQVLEVLRSGRLALGPKTEEFEQLLASFTGVPWAAAVSSGTAGLHLAVRALGIGPEDCVVTSSFSFIASANCIRYEGAQPVFVDIDPETLCLDPEKLAAYLGTCRVLDGRLQDPQTGRRVAAVLAVDVFGHPADWPRILELAREHGLLVIADSCEALGSTYRASDRSRRHAGSEANLAVLAFYPNKQFTTGEGGAVLGSEPELQDRIKSLRNHGRREGDPWLRHHELGFNYRMDEMSAALGVAQVRRAEEILERRRRVATWYSDAFSGMPGLRLPEATHGANPAWFVYFIQVASRRHRDHLLQHLESRGIETKAYFDPPIHLQAPYASRAFVRGGLPATEDASGRTLILPFFGRMSREQVEAVAAAVRAGIAGVH